MTQTYRETMFSDLPSASGAVAQTGGNPTGAQEIDRQHNVLWNYVSKCPQTLACERLPNGNTLIGEQGPSQAVEVSPDGSIWFGGREALWRYDPARESGSKDRFQSFSRTDGLIGNNVYSTCREPAGSFWVATGMGAAAKCIA
jgi:hypothetical protein